MRWSKDQGKDEVSDVVYGISCLCCCRVVGGAMEHVVQYGSQDTRLYWRSGHLHLVCSVGVSNGRHSAADGRSIGVPTHAQTTLVSQSLFLPRPTTFSNFSRLVNS